MKIRETSAPRGGQLQANLITRQTGRIWPALRFSLAGLGLLWLASGCAFIPSGEAQSESRKKDEMAAVDVQVATPSSTPAVEYTGTTAPRQEVVVRSQISGQLLSLQVEVGDTVEKGQLLGRQDDALLTANVNEARAQRATQVFEVAGAQSKVGEVNTRVAQARLQLIQAQGDVVQLQRSLQANIEAARLEAQQTQADAQRLSQLAKAGATTEQQAEQARTRAQQAQQNLLNLRASRTQQITQAQTAAKNAEQLLKAAKAQVAIEERGVDAAQGRVLAQQAVVNQNRRQQSYALLSSPINGQVMAQVAEAGNLLQPGSDILRLGDFSQIKVIVPISELMLPKLRVGQSVQIRLDAFPKQRFRGKIARIPPAANPTSRLLPIELLMANDNGQIGSGLLARVSFTQANQPQVQVPETALQAPGSKPKSGQSPSPAAKGKGRSPGSGPPRQRPEFKAKPGDSATIFVFDDQRSRVQARSVILGNQSNGQVQIVQGLKPGERFVARSSQPLEDGAVVNLSAISDPARPKDQ